MTLPVYFIFLISGVSGLVYQVIWVREFGQIFGNTVQSASLVSGTFILGLGIGSYVAGKIIDGKNKVNAKAGLVYYAYSELVIAALGLGVSLLIPHLEALSPTISSYTRGEHGWYELTAMSYLARYVTAIALVGPVTVLMGATLTFLIRFVLSRSVKEAGWKIGLLYGMNTLGAAVGCALVDLWAVPAMGLLHTKMIAVALNAVAGLCALLLSARTRVVSDATPPNAVIDAQPRHDQAAVRKGKRQKGPPDLAPKPVPPIASARLSLARAGLAIAISGFCAMGMEMVWFRFMSSVYSQARYVFSLLLVTVLMGMWLGSFLAGYLSRKPGYRVRLYIYSQLLFAVSVLVCLFAFLESDRGVAVDLFRHVLFGAHPVAQDSMLFTLYDYAFILLPSFVTMFVPALFMGFAFPAINSAIQDSLDSVGSKAGGIYLWNCTGAVLGAFATGFVLLPAIGMQHSITLLAIGSAAAILPVSPLRSAERKGAGTIPIGVTGCVMLFVAVTAVWIGKPADYVIRNSFFTDWKRVLQVDWIRISEGINEIALVGEGRQKGGAWRRLYTNGHPMSGTDYFSLRYMTSFVHIPLLQMDRPESVLVICFGVGNTLHAASLYPTVSNLQVVDLSKNILELAPYFRKWNTDVLSDPRTKVFVNDGRQHLRMQPEQSYDLVTLEPPPLNHAGVASLYSEEFYRLVHRTLKKGGYLSQWLPVYEVAEEHNRRLIKSFMNVFPNAVLLNGANKEFILLGRKEGPNEIDWRAFQARLRANERVAKELESVDLGDPIEWLGMFAASSSHLSRALRHVQPMTDDDPVIENNHFLKNRYVPKEIFDASGLAQWCPSCFVDGRLSGELEPLGRYLAVLQDVYRNPDFLKDGPFSPEKKIYKVQFAKADNAGAVAHAAHPLVSPTQDQFRALLKQYFYLTTFGPDWAFEYQP